MVDPRQTFNLFPSCSGINEQTGQQIKNHNKYQLRRHKHADDIRLLQ